jgi:integrase
MTMKKAGMRGLYIRGSSYVVVATNRNGDRVWKSIGDVKSFKDRKAAQAFAGEVVRAIKAGKDTGGPETFDTVAKAFVKHHVQHSKLRSEKEIQRYLDTKILPAFSGRVFTSIGRGDVSKLLDKIVDESGSRTADIALAVLSKMINWYATRHDDYTSPIVKGMNRYNSKERQGKRILTDDELRAVWTAAEANDMFGAFIRMALLTGQRREKIASMKWADIDGNVWTIPTEEREKTNAGELVLPPDAVAILDAIPRFANSPYVFTAGNSYLKSFTDEKNRFDAKVPIAPWRVHDLRRTAKSLMAAAGVLPHVSEQVLGHSIKGVEGIYDRHKYRDEKVEALLRLSHKIREIVNPAPDNVTQLRERTANERS